MTRSLSLSAFQEAYVSTETLDEESFGDFDARRTRYEILWSQYQNDVYRNVHAWAKTYKTRYALYQYIRNIYNPAYRLGEFWKAHLWGGSLDREAENEGALPIETDNETLRPAIAQLWQWSNMYTRKDLITLRGAILGDAIIRVVDDATLGKVYLELVHPGIVSSMVKDAFGNIKAYEIIEERVNPINGQLVTYKETAERDGQDVVYRTYMNDALFSWNGISAQWTEPYGFIPMVHIQHNDVGLSWGWSELHPARSKMHEVDDLASLLSDQMRKAVLGSGFAFIGAAEPTTSPTPSTYVTRQATENLATQGTPEMGREEINAIYIPSVDARVEPLLIDLDMEGSILHIQEILKELERDYPELRFDALRASGDVSGKSLRVARQPAETKVEQRRANYDNALVRAQQMAISIGGLRGYFPGFNLDSYDAGDLEHSIGDRPVFYSDPVDQYEEDKAFWDAAKVATEAGLPLKVYLKRQGWTDEELAELEAEDAVQSERQVGIGVPGGQMGEVEVAL